MTDDRWKNHIVSEEPIDSTLTSNVHVFSISVFCTGPGALDANSVPDMLKKKAKNGMKSNR